MQNNEAASDEERLRTWVFGMLRFVRSFIRLARSEWRAAIFAWALTVSYLIATHLRPVPTTVSLLAASGYLLTFSIYVLNSLTDINEDRINSIDRPLASGSVTHTEGRLVFLFSLFGAFFLVSFLGLATFALYVIALFLGIAYSIPRIRAKERFPLKMIVDVSGASIAILTGGVAAQDLNPLVFFAAVAFALFSLTALLLGDIADIRGDVAEGIKSLPVVIGPKNSIWVTLMIPVTVGSLVLLLFQTLHLNLIFMISAVCLSGYSALEIGKLAKKYEDPQECRKVKKSLRIVNLLLLLALLLGLITL